VVYFSNIVISSDEGWESVVGGWSTLISGVVALQTLGSSGAYAQSLQVYTEAFGHDSRTTVPG